MKFNLNSYVTVELNEIGISILRERRERLRETFPAFEEFIPPVGPKKFQLWDFMHTFGPHVHMGKPLPFKSTEIELEDL